MNDDADKEFSVETPVGKIQTKGYHLGNVLQMVLAAIMALGLYMFFDLRNEARATWEKMALAAKAEHSALTVSIDRQTEEMEVMNYLQTLSQADRERLNLRMPESLRRKLPR